MRNFLTAMVLFIALMVGTSYGAIFTEIGDAGESLATALPVIDGTTQIEGSYGDNEADMFVFFWSGGALEIYAHAHDPQLFLFDANGVGVWANDDGGSGFDAMIYDSNLASGIYYLGISDFNYDPYSNSGLIFPSSPWYQQFGPQNTDPLAYWDGWSDASSYTITFSSPVDAPSNPVPEPCTMLLMGTGLVGAGLLCKKRKK